MIESLILQTGTGDWRAQAEVFDEIFFVFMALGTLVGTVVVAYTLYNAYKYRDDGSEPGEEFEPPVLGELPTGQGGPKAKKLFLSFGLSAIVVISLVVYAYGLLLYVEEGPQTEVEEEMEVEVVGFQFGWEYVYPNGHTEMNELVVPEDTVIRLEVTSRDVWHNFGVPELRIKADSIPGEHASTWFTAEEGEYHVECFELCGSGHSQMTGTITVLEQEEFDEWYENTEPDESAAESDEEGDE